MDARRGSRPRAVESLHRYHRHPGGYRCNRRLGLGYREHHARRRPELATYQVVQILGRIPFFIASAFAVIVFPRMARLRAAGE